MNGDAVAFGELYERSNSSFVDAVQLRHQCGQGLAEKKAKMAHGEWVPWLNVNQDTLGFTDRRTAWRLMKAANGASTHHLDVSEALSLSRQMWGNTKAFIEHNTGNNEWYTPAGIIEAARSVLGGFDLDPASSKLANKTVGADLYYTAEQAYPRAFTTGQ